MKNGVREGPGRPAGWRKPEGVREQHQIRAYPEEWALIQKFCRLVKHGKKDDCEKFLTQFNDE